MNLLWPLSAFERYLSIDLTDGYKVKVIIESFPFELAFADLIDESPAHVVRRHLADVVDANVELVSFVDERVAATASLDCTQKSFYVFTLGFIR